MNRPAFRMPTRRSVADAFLDALDTNPVLSLAIIVAIIAALALAVWL